MIEWQKLLIFLQPKPHCNNSNNTLNKIYLILFPLFTVHREVFFIFRLIFSKTKNYVKPFKTFNENANINAKFKIQF